MNKQRLVKTLSNHILKLSHDNQLLAKSRWSELITLTNGDKKVLTRLSNMQSKSYEEMLLIAKKIIIHFK
jgi:hypothetical protein